MCLACNTLFDICVCFKVVILYEIYSSDGKEIKDFIRFVLQVVPG